MVDSSFLLLAPVPFRNLIIEVTLLFAQGVEAFRVATALIICLKLSRWSRHVCTNKCNMSRKQQFATACTVFWQVSLWWKESYTAKATFLLERRGFLQHGHWVCSSFTLLPVGVCMVKVASPGDCLSLLCTWLLRQEVLELEKRKVCLKTGTVYEDRRLSIRNEKHSRKCCVQIALNLFTG